MTSPKNSVLYTGMTNDLAKRVFQHAEMSGSAFTKKYQAKKLVYYEIFESAYEAIRREKQIKAGSRQKKVELINRMNPK
ncbi:MAG: excinuclease ABC subunit C [candidate division Zixibacteria bacterium RBG_16_48_11]|nr:MAG: excinuclease ABC subunit C [candidate division Zixibacteria bacterium RBG_16_48_11]